ncbi:MAG: DPP IV N-terminal domain-containing protein [Candidatus Syntrophosphaera sp.]|nr:DPP IV N-terminal domain-containing protein [Candidatus Syntrophosphaera sp.]
MTRSILLAFILLAFAAAGFALYPEFASDPAISPDGTQVCFVYDGDLWLVPFSGGEAKRLTATQAGEWGPIWSPDGKWIAFNANREGSVYPYLMPSEGGPARPIIAETYYVSDWFSDGANLLCTRYNQTHGNSFYKVPLDGSRPLLLAEIGDRYASLSRDNRSIVFNRRGNPHREAYRGSVAGELWQIDIATRKYKQLTFTDFTERYPRFSHASNALYYCASDGDRFQIYRAENLDFSNPVQLTDLPLWSARDISLARANDRLVFEHFNEIWKYDPDLNQSFKLQISINQDIWQQERRQEKMKDDFHAFAVSADELLVALRYKYDTFFMPRKGGEVRQFTDWHAAVGNMEFLEDGRTLLLQMLEDGKRKLYRASCDSTMAVAPLDWFGRADLDVENMYKDPSGKWVIYYGDNRLSSRIAIGDKNLQNIRPLDVSRPVVTNFAINASGDYAVYATTREDVWMRELWLYDFAKNEHTKLVNEDAWIHSLAWTPDNRSILMSRSGGIYRLDLVPRDEFEFEKDHWAEIFSPQPEEEEDNDARVIDSDYVMEIDSSDSEEKEEPKKKPKPEPVRELRIVWEDLDKRLFPVLTDSGFSLTLQKVIDDSTFYYTARNTSSGTPTELKKANIYGQNAKKEFELGQDVGTWRWVGETLHYLKGGVINYYNTQKRSKGEVKAEFDYSYDSRLLNTRVFEQVWGVFGLNFYDPDMHGKNWQELYRLYHPYAENTRSIDDIATIVNEMIGDVNASHTGFYPRREGSGPNRQLAYLGLEFDQSIRLREGIRVGLVYPTSRLASFYNLQAGDIITHIDGVAITAKTPVDSLLLDKVGKRIKLQYSSDGASKEAVVTGLNYSENRRLYYTHKVSTSGKTVAEQTDGRIGYVHIPAMGSRDYDNFYRDVFRDNADKEALIIDVRGNSGGHIHDQIITLLSRQSYAWSTSRRYSGEKNPEPRRAWTRPTIVLVDENSFSDGEIFPTVYQELKLGKVVGMPSSGSVIGTWQYDLLDGSSMRLPGSGWYRMDGSNMEGNGVVPDILVEISPEDQIAGRDTQLLRAIQEIQKELP